MKKPYTLKIPKCAKCGKTLEPEFTTEQKEGDKGKPRALIMFGRCDDCHVITVCDIVDTNKLNFVKSIDDLENSVNAVNSEQEDKE